jgi:hypothetical protein
MAVTRVGGFTGAVSFVTGLNADFSAWNLKANQPVDDDTSYTDTGTGASSAGAGTIDYSLTASGFLKANAASTAPGMASLSATPAAVTLTAKTGCTEAGNFVVAGATIDHRKRAGAIPVSYEGKGDSDLTETWALS